MPVNGQILEKVVEVAFNYLSLRLQRPAVPPSGICLARQIDSLTGFIEVAKVIEYTILSFYAPL
jgi:hypothetical protein